MPLVSVLPLARNSLIVKALYIYICMLPYNYYPAFCNREKSKALNVNIHIAIELLTNSYSVGALSKL